MRIGRVEVDEVRVLAFRQLDVRPGGEREGQWWRYSRRSGICTVKLAVKVTIAT